MKKILSILLLSVMALTAMAADGNVTVKYYSSDTEYTSENYETLAAAATVINAATGLTKIELTVNNSLTETAQVYFRKVDGSEEHTMTIKCADGCQMPPLELGVYSNITIESANITSTDVPAIKVDDSANVEIQGGTYCSTGANTVESGNLAK